VSTYRVGHHQPQNVYRDDQYIGVMFTAEDAALVVEALNGAVDFEVGPCVGICAGCSPDCSLVGDSCSCELHRPDPGCVVHHGRRARGPKPPPLGEGCICDGSGRTCPRHGAVI
jgi:hypothetical protein